MLTGIDADYSFSGNARITYPGIGTGYMDRVDDGSVLNASERQLPGAALRVRNPSRSRYLELLVPSEGYENIRLDMALRRTSNGAQQQALWYRARNQDPWMRHPPGGVHQLLRQKPLRWI